MQLTWLAAQWCGLAVTCNVQHIVTNHTECQISQERRAALPSPITGAWLHMLIQKMHYMFIQKMRYSLTSCQLYFLVPLSSFLAHFLAYTDIVIYIYIYIWVILLKTGQNCDIEGKNSKCEFFLCYYLEMNAWHLLCT